MPYQACFKGLGIYPYWVNYYAVAYDLKAGVLSLKVCKYTFYSLSFHSFFLFSSFHFLN